VSTVPAEIAGIGSTQQRLRVSPGFDPLKAQVGPEEYFVLSRIDGVQTLREILLATGLPVDRAVAIITRLRSIGALLLPGEQAAPSPVAAPRMAASNRHPTDPGRKPIQPVGVQHTPTAGASHHHSPQPAPPQQPVDMVIGHDLSLSNPTAEELAALAEVNDLEDIDRRRILALSRLIQRNDPHALLGLRPGADPRDLKRAYFQLSKEIHPDRYYGKRLGSFAARMPIVFEATSRAYARLTNTDKKTGSSGAFQAIRTDPQQPQSPQAYAAELFDRACQNEVSGDHMGAMKLFAAAVRVDPQLRYLRRAASCALAAGQPRSAVEYAKKAHGIAPNDPSSARLLAASFRAAGKLNDAEEVLVMAMAIKSENDALTSELRNDLAEVRRLLAQ
jgi:hypothetical protein